MPTTRLVRVDALQSAKIFGTLYALLSLVFVPFLVLAALLGRTQFGVGFALFFPVIYAIAGFVGVGILVALFNVVCPRLGGIALTLEPADVRGGPAVHDPGSRPPIIPGA